jgi:hypothetical protein
LLRRKARLGTLRPTVDEPLWTRAVEAMDPVTQGLAVHAPDLRTIGALLDCFTQTECANYFRNAGRFSLTRSRFRTGPRTLAALERSQNYRQAILPFLARAGNIDDR